MRAQNFIVMAVVLVTIAVLTVALRPTLAIAGFPEKPITIIVAFAPGGPNDINIRTLAKAAEKYLGTPIIIDNKGGAGGMVGLSLVANAKPDGYTLAGATSVSVVRGPQLQKVTFKPLKSFTPVIGYALPQHALMVRDNSPWKSLQEFVDFAKKNPNKIKYGSAGVGTGVHLAMEYIAHREGIKWIHVPYKSGPEMTAALLGAHVDATELVSGSQIEGVRLLAYFQEKRNPRRPDVPTLRELGYDFVNDSVFSIIGPAGLPAEVLKTLENTFARATETEQFKSVIDKLDLVPVSYNSEEYTEYLKNSWAKTEKMFKETGIIKEVATQPY